MALLLACIHWRMLQSVSDCIRPYCCADGDDLASAAGKRVIVCTCSTAGIFYTMNLLSTHFTHVFVDEVTFVSFSSYNRDMGCVLFGRSNWSGQFCSFSLPGQLTELFFFTANLVDSSTKLPTQIWQQIFNWLLHMSRCSVTLYVIILAVYLELV